MQPSWSFLFSRPSHFLAFGFGSGLAPKAPGTFGTLAAFPVYFMLMGLNAPGYWLAVGLMTVAGVWICDQAGKALGVHDHGGIVWDEIAAFLMVLPWSPEVWWGMPLAFVLFRLFDIWKPFPIRWFDQHVHGGFGVMLDDVLAAVYAILVLWGLSLWM